MNAVMEYFRWLKTLEDMFHFSVRSSSHTGMKCALEINGFAQTANLVDLRPLAFH